MRLAASFLLALALASTSSAVDVSLPPVVHGDREFDNAQIVDLDDDGRGDYLLPIPSSVGDGVIVRLNLGQGDIGPDLTYTFNPPSSRRTGGIFTFHLNADVLPDLVVRLTLRSGGCTSGGIAILLNQGNGVFATPQYFLFGQASVVILAHDVSGDGARDLVVSTREDCGGAPFGDLLVFLNDGTGVFASPTAYLPSNADPSHVAVGQFSTDALPDIAVSGTGQYLPNLGGGVFGPPVTFTTPDPPHWMGAAALDTLPGDDLVVFDLNDDAFHVFLNDGAGGFTQSTQTVADAEPWMHDYDGDGDADVLFREGTLMVNDNGVFTPTALALQGFIDPALAADFDDDGERDFATRFGDFFRVYRGLGGTSFQASPRYHGEVGAVLDYDDDGNPDLLWFLTGFPSGFRFFENQGDATFVAVIDSELSADPIGGGELDLTAGEEIVVRGTSAVSAFGVVPGTTNGAFGAIQWYGWSDGVPHQMASLARVVVEDLNNDGMRDLVFPRTDGANGAVSVRWNRSGSFPDATNLGVGTAPFRVIAGDFKEDGLPDLVADGWASFFMFFENQGSEAFAPATFVEAGTPSFLAAGDVDNDTHMDVVTRVAGALNWHAGDGNGGFSSATLIATIGSGDFVEAVDVNMDAIVDIIAVESGNPNEALVWINHGSGTFGAAARYPLLDPTTLTLRDLDGDMAPEIVASSAANTVVLRNLGDGTFEPCASYPLGDEHYVTDATGDTKPDIIETNALFTNIGDDPTPVLFSDPVVRLDDAGVHLAWTLDHVSGAVAETHVERSETALGPFVVLERMAWSGQRVVSFHDASVVAGRDYWYRLVVLDAHLRETSAPVHVRVAGASGAQLLTSPAPNGEGVEIRYRIDATTPMHLALYDVRGRHVRTLVRDPQRQAGTYLSVWNGRDARGSHVARGIYLVRLDTGNVQHVRRLPYLPQR